MHTARFPAATYHDLDQSAGIYLLNPSLAKSVCWNIGIDSENDYEFNWKYGLAGGTFSLNSYYGPRHSQVETTGDGLASQVVGDSASRHVPTPIFLCTTMGRGIT